MKRLWLLSWPLLLAAAPADNDYLAAGQWQSSIQIEGASLDGKELPVKERPTLQPPRCVKNTENKPMTFFAYSEDPECQTLSLNAGKGQVTMSGVCQKNGKNLTTIEAKGDYHLRDYSMAYIMRSEENGHKLEVRGHMSGHSIGLCPAKDSNADDITLGNKNH
ncbi:uncharacterized protein ZMO1_ZMO1248 [Zymomonas mobilis subsp. mobilis ZM4 = ATCC 31821]|uniref:DUF3617 family protein n=2 Tax=Zymomonas mobilis subsp. mobilis TaxID=120045 RepID=Q5NN38_ZYMMO|nr:DUF3617 domain-containing protein [Zymomonas mobilis]AAV89872.1 hypothetical protein ZMO1248 [Zymomonas mobilis subsp. mobilis ZM4 = ATCC 31821]ACV74643.1 hypothetical protein Za10_0089 [Zymomonas mobilis subsp. mobilis NCIMB 11163]AEH61946.1 conserved hypothetical protein [Zymomonas mobilis subsp. mobilis ATCC 10988]AHB09426.1 Protein of unknown function (DUF3617) [Zymomonas mobilis subsp. mobilis str. CP4 = NRRL B-14023]AHJ69732.1 hypothetical protein A254_00088 [Zymomonas mobilis subsp. 